MAVTLVQLLSDDTALLSWWKVRGQVGGDRPVLVADVFSCGSDVEGWARFMCWVTLCLQVISGAH